VSHAAPWANPGAVAKILKWLGREDAPLLFRLRADPYQWLWGLRFLAECLPGRDHSNATQLLRLGLYSRAMLRELRASTGIEYDHLERGILHFYTSQAELDASARAAELMRGLGSDRTIKTPDECIAIEPALAMRGRLAGGSYSASDETGDAHNSPRRSPHCARIEASNSTRVRRSSGSSPKATGSPESKSPAETPSAPTRTCFRSAATARCWSGLSAFRSRSTRQRATR
jgi:hypothetical protein